MKFLAGGDLQGVGMYHRGNSEIKLGGGGVTVNLNPGRRKLPLSLFFKWNSPYQGKWTLGSSETVGGASVGATGPILMSVC